MFEYRCVDRYLCLGFLLSWMALFSSAGNCHAEGLRWLRVPHNAASDARRLGRPILVYVGANNCHYCRVMDRETWQNNRIVRQVSDEWVPLKVVAEENEVLVEKFQVSVYPTTLLFSPERKLISRLEGYFPPEALSDSLSKARVAKRKEGAVTR